MQLSKKVQKARVSGTVKLAQLARDLKDAGRDIIELGEGEPDFDTPEFVTDAAFAAAKAGATRYTAVAGTTELRQAICNKFRAQNAISYTPDEVIVGTGAKQLIFNALMASLNPGDEVIVPAPYWVSYPDMVRISDGTPVVVPCSAEDGFKLSAKALRAAITGNTRWLILNSPGNPTGAVYSADDLRALADVLREHRDVALMCDDIYEAIVFDTAIFATMVEVAPDLKDRVLTVNGVSKSYAMTGWRIGYAGGPQDLIAAMTKLQGQSTTNPSSVGQAAALAALTGPQDYLSDWNSAYARRRDLVRDALSVVDGLAMNQPDGAFYHFIACGALTKKTTPGGKILSSDNDLSSYLLQDAGVALVPGSEFGAPGHLRLCFAKSDDALAEACARISKAVGQLR